MSEWYGEWLDRLQRRFAFLKGREPKQEGADTEVYIVWHAGRAYVPITPSWPDGKARLQQFVLTLAGVLPEEQLLGNVVAVDQKNGIVNVFFNANREDRVCPSLFVHQTDMVFVG